MTILEKFEEINEHRKELIEIDNDLYSRGRKAKSAIVNLEEEKAQLKADRPALLADNEDVSELNKRLKEIDDEIELNQDTIIGVEEKRKKLNHEIFMAKQHTNSAYKDVLDEKLEQLAPLYVKAGKKFVKILKEYITLEGIRDLNSSANTKVGWSFTKIPNVMCEQEPLMDNNHYEICRQLTEEVSKKYGIPDYMPERLSLF